MLSYLDFFIINIYKQIIQSLNPLEYFKIVHSTHIPLNYLVIEEELKLILIIFLWMIEHLHSIL